MEVLDASSLSLLATVDWAYGSTNGYNSFLMGSDSTGKMYWFVRGDSVLAIDTDSDTVVARLGVGSMQARGCVDHSGRYIFNPNPSGFNPDPDYNSLIIYDTQSDSVAAVYEDLPSPLSAVSNPGQRRIYVGCTDVILVYPDAPPGIHDEPAASTSSKPPSQTVVRNTLFLPEATSRKPQAACLMDISGRKVLDLGPGANDVRTLAPGVYFVREAQAQAQAVRKVVIAR